MSNVKFIGIKFAERFPLFSKFGDKQDTPNEGPFYSANEVLSWEIDTPRNRLHLENSVEYWKARGYTPTLVTK